MSSMKRFLSVLGIATVVSQPLHAETLQGAEQAQLIAAFGHDIATTQEVAVLEEDVLQETDGRLAPLALALAITGVDLALAGFYWGVYVPHYYGGAYYQSP
ncbi:MAG: hypothetical protein ABJ013_06920 [Halioglobus sp.]